MGRSLNAGLGSALFVAIASAGACSSDFENCSETAQCAGPTTPDDGGDGGSGAENDGKGGTSGKGGSGGKGGTTPSDGGSAGGDNPGDAGSGGDQSPPVACTIDDECDDGAFCNGLEQCVDNFCADGTSPCENAEPDHCVITCEEGTSAAICGLEGRDADNDGHLDDACSENAGDDCDDSAATGGLVFPGADEICNAGVDDDCDGEDETTDEVLLAGTSGVVVPSFLNTVRHHPSIAAVPTGGFGVVWADERSGASHIHYRPLAANGTTGTDLALTTGTVHYGHDYPDLAVWSGEFVVAYRAQATDDDHSAIRAIEVKYDASLKENEVTSNDNVQLYSRPQLSTSNIYFKVGGDDLILCAKAGGCNPLGPTTPYQANTFHVSPLSQRLIYDWAGDLFFENPPTDFNPVLLPESPAETRSNPVITEDGSAIMVAYRYEDGIRAGVCELPDGIPIDLVDAGNDEFVLLYWNPTQTSLHVRTFSKDCALTAHAMVAEENGTVIGSAALAIDINGVVAVVWSNQTMSTNEWTINQRMFSPSLCE